MNFQMFYLCVFVQGYYSDYCLQTSLWILMRAWRSNKFTITAIPSNYWPDYSLNCTPLLESRIKTWQGLGSRAFLLSSCNHIENVRKRKRLIIVYSYTDLTLALMISFPGGSGYNLRTLSQSCFNQGSTTASGLKRQTLNDLKKMLYTLTKSTTAFVKWTFWRSKS